MHQQVILTAYARPSLRLGDREDSTTYFSGLRVDLHQIAIANWARFPDRSVKCSDTQFVCSDAVGYELPRTPTVLFLYNPFTGVVAEQFFSRLVESIKACPREIQIHYVNPVARDFLERYKLFRKIAETDNFVSYDFVPLGSR